MDGDCVSAAGHVSSLAEKHCESEKGQRRSAEVVRGHADVASHTGLRDLLQPYSH